MPDPTGRRALLASALLLTAGCRTPSPTAETSPATSPDGVPESCTGEGRHIVDASSERPLSGAPEVDGTLPQAALGYSSPDASTGRVLLSAPAVTDDVVQLEGGLGQATEIGPWTVTIRSICADGVRLDVELTDP